MSEVAVKPYGMTTPCPECPFRREKKGCNPVRLRPARVAEIANLMLSPHSGEFPCHKTTGAAGGNCPSKTIHCAGALIFAVKNDNYTQMMRIAGRIGLFDPDKLTGHDDVFDDVDEMMESALPARSCEGDLMKRKRGRKKK